MSPIFDCRDEAQLLSGMRQARQAIGRGELVVMPTDPVYGVAADAFSAKAVQRLLDAKGRGRQSPPPVLVAGLTTLRALVADVPTAVERLVEEFWPGGLTIVLPAQPSLSWDLGETHGTVAVRMPAHRIALELLEETGPLAVSSANLTGKPAAVRIEDAQDMLGESIAVYLDDGYSKTGISSTIVDATSLVGGSDPRIRERDVHKTPTPRLGGIAMFLGVVAAIGVSAANPYFAIVWSVPHQVYAILVATVIIVIVGVADDLWDLDWFIKLGAQFIAAGVIAWFGELQIYSLPIGGLTVGSGWVSFTLTVFAIVIVMNAVNFIDGLDGL